MADDGIEMPGTIIELLGGSMFRVQVSTGENEEPHLVLATLSGKMRKNKIRVVLGDEVRVSVSPYDPSRGRITYRKR